ncbi:MAG: hypothetical protein QOI51_242, partial [Nocardioidaceae bacterium]|nr:hypothetical protein [Nocardioidaceae bacterium]
AASGLVNVSQQVGASVGLAVLVTIFGSAQGSGSSPTFAGVSAAEQARRAFVNGADAAFLGGAILLATAVVIVAALVRRKQLPDTDPGVDLDLELELETELDVEHA